MRRILASILILTVAAGCLVFLPSPVFADGKDIKIPYGQAKKYFLDLDNFWEEQWEDFFKELEKRLNKNLNKESQVKFLTRSQLAQILAERYDDFAGFANQNEILNKIADKGAIPSQYKKAVAYAISKDLMTYKKLANGKINFQPNKAATIKDVNRTKKGSLIDQTVTLSGTVRFIYQTGGKTWLALETNEGILRTAYFPEGSVPGGLQVGGYLQLKVQDDRIVESSLNKNLLTANQSNIESGTTGFSPYGPNTYAGSTLSRDTNLRWEGAASLKVQTNGLNPWQGVSAVYNGSQLSGNLAYSFYCWAPQGVPLRAVIFDNTNGTYPAGSTLEFTGSGSWERKVVSFTPTAATGNLFLQVTLNNYSAATAFWLDGLQLENGSQATAWTPGGP